MQANRCGKAIGLAMLLLVAACGPRDPRLMAIGSNSKTPDEFSILPTKPIEIPDDLAALPVPTPGAGNRVDPTPQADAVAALGGNPARIERDGNVTSDGRLVSYTTRYGTNPTIRKELLAEDIAFRRDNQGRLLERWFNLNVYYKAYERQSLDQFRELERFRKAGVRTVGAPPDPNTAE